MVFTDIPDEGVFDGEREVEMPEFVARLILWVCMVSFG
jgi:hypothetical protein